MRFCILGSGSEGNCALLQTPRARILIDAGFSARKTEQLLAAVGESLDRIDAIFITHEHGDHAAALTGLAKHAHIKIFANAPTAHALQARLKHKIPWLLFETGSRFEFLDLRVDSFSVPHDAQEPVGFFFSQIASDAAARARSVAWLTDLGHAPQHIHERIREAEVLVVEANHCADMLKNDTKRPWSLKQRISGRHGHLSNRAARELLEAVTQPKWRQIYLTHLSRDCNSAEAIGRAFAGIDATVRCPFSVVLPGAATAFYEFL